MIREYTGGAVDLENEMGVRCDDRCEIKNPLKAWRLMVIYSIESQLCGTSVEERSAGVTGTAAVSP